MHSTEIVLEQTCGASPEQYEAYAPNGEHVGYLRMRHGHFTVEYPDLGGTLVYEAWPDGDGAFHDYERDRYLNDARVALCAASRLARETRLRG